MSRAAAWAYVRAGLISLVLASQCVSAIPERPLRERDLARPEGQRVTGLLSRVSGASRESIERSLLAASASIIRARNGLLRPLEPVQRAAALRQQWSLFSVSSPYAFRLRVEAARAGSFQLVYEANGVDTLGLGRWLRYRRMRALYAPSGNSGARRQYSELVDWLAAKVLREHPEYDALRVSMERLEFATRERPNLSLGIEDVELRRRSELP
ncbi:MAG TPA: hypothetical protein VJR89_26420 [Polyangiales bacterium]|nr:hypothetical protein [Polyangiales bacterium]